MHLFRIRATAHQFAALAAPFVLGACKGRDEAGDTTLVARVDSAARGVGAAVDTAARKVESAAGSLLKRGAWTDASILAFSTVASAGELRESELATRKATNPAVKQFARQLVADHRALLAEGKALASKLNVAPDTADGDVRDIAKRSDDDIKELTDKPAGADWDKEYIDQQINDHRDTLDKLQDAAKNTTNAELRAALEKATGKVREHLTKAQDIKANVLKD